MLHKCYLAHHAGAGNALRDYKVDEEIYNRPEMGVPTSNRSLSDRDMNVTCLDYLGQSYT